jgi:rubrerythrin
VTTIAHRTDKLREVEDDERRAWGTYRETLRELTGEDYERTEHESWEQLQGELRRLEQRRRTLATP